ncbi:hypothetical protein ABIF65_011664 [Bradyrhizobium japonicum]
MALGKQWIVLAGEEEKGLIKRHSHSAAMDAIAASFSKPSEPTAPSRSLSEFSPKP